MFNQRLGHFFTTTFSGLVKKVVMTVFAEAFDERQSLQCNVDFVRLYSFFDQMTDFSIVSTTFNGFNTVLVFMAKDYF